MLKKRIVVSLTYNASLNVVRPVQFTRPYRMLGGLQQYINVLEQRNIDELILTDICATEDGRQPKFQTIAHIIKGLFCPITCVGGIRSLSDIDLYLRHGADKVGIKTNTHLIHDAARRFGSQAIVAVVDYPEIDDVAAVMYEEEGAGEILLCSQLHDGLMQGYDVELIENVGESVSIPVVALGGAGSVSHCAAAFDSGADAVAAGSMFLYTEITPRSLAKELSERGYPVRT